MDAAEKNIAFSLTQSLSLSLSHTHTHTFQTARYGRKHTTSLAFLAAALYKCYTTPSSNLQKQKGLQLQVFSLLI
jgi:hypothetical protein